MSSCLHLAEGKVCAFRLAAIAVDVCVCAQTEHKRTQHKVKMALNYISYPSFVIHPGEWCVSGLYVLCVDCFSNLTRANSFGSREILIESISSLICCAVCVSRARRPIFITWTMEHHALSKCMLSRHNLEEDSQSQTYLHSCDRLRAVSCVPFGWRNILFVFRLVWLRQWQWQRLSHYKYNLYYTRWRFLPFARSIFLSARECRLSCLLDCFFNICMVCVQQPRSASTFYLHLLSDKLLVLKFSRLLFFTKAIFLLTLDD